MFELKETDRTTELVRSTDSDGSFQLVKDFKFSIEEKSSSSGCRELLAVHKMLVSESECFSALKGGTVYWQTDSKNCYSFLMRGSRKPDIQRIVADIKCYERKLDIRIVPVWTPRSQSRIVTADLGSTMASSMVHR